MKGMILAAGLGKRLGPLTEKYPKALVPLAGRPMISHIIERLQHAGINEIIVNVHHRAEQLVDYLNKHKSPSLRLEISREEYLLNTGGGLKQASWFFDDGMPFVMHNVDVISDIDLINLVSYHMSDPETMATLAVSGRKSSRYLLFNKHAGLSGWYSNREGRDRFLGSGTMKRLAFQGIHVLSPRIFNYFPPSDEFTILDAYLDIAERGKKIKGCEVSPGFWIDVGKPENLETAEKFLQSSAETG